MRRLIIGGLLVCGLAAYWLTTSCGYMLIEDISATAAIGSPTYKLEVSE